MAGAAVALTMLGCGGEGREEKLAWMGRPRVVVPPDLPHDRILSGRVRNDSDEPLRLRVEDLRLEGAGGRGLEADFGFIAGYVMPDATQNRAPDLDQSSGAEKRRLGRVVELEPGETAPLTVAWRLRPGEPRRARLDYGTGSLTVSR